MAERWKNNRYVQGFFAVRLGSGELGGGHCVYMFYVCTFFLYILYRCVWQGWLYSSSVVVAVDFISTFDDHG